MGVITNYEIHPLANMLPAMTEEEFRHLKEDISGLGQIEPIVLFEGKILDGRHRYQACCELGFEPIVTNRDLDGMSAIDFVRALNLNRRHLSVSQKAMVSTSFLAYAEQRAKERQVRKPAGSVVAILPEQPSRATDEVAEKVGVSGRTVRDAKVIVNDGTEEEKASVVQGEKTVSSVAKEVRKRKKAKKYSETPMFNRTNDSAIEWAKYTWNPVTGCKHGCSYCYARGIAERRIGVYETVGFNPHFHEERIAAPRNTPLPKNPNDRFCFVSSMGDLFGEWVPEEWIIKVFVAIENSPDWTFLLLTKNPERYVELYKEHGEEFFPMNVWLGASGTNQKQVDRAVDSFFELADRGQADDTIRLTYLSCEPLQEEVCFGKTIGAGENIYYGVHWVIVGAQSNPDVQPEWKWVDSLLEESRDAGIPIYFKPNLKVRPKERPQQTTKTQEN